MEVKDLKWYSAFLFLLGAILSFADPITDILTLVEFYRTDHKTWFGVGLAFVILPGVLFAGWSCLFRINADEYESISFARLSDVTRTNADEDSAWRNVKAFLRVFHPFSAALVRFQGFLFCLKKWWRGDEIDSGSTDKAEDVLFHIDVAVLFEAVLESAPQFILQLYAVSVQEKPVTVIQMISLPVSFLSLAWAFTTADEWNLSERGIISSSSDLTVKHKIALYVTHLLLLSSRLFATGFFTVSYKCPHSNTWYSLPVTVCVCVFSALGSIMRITLLLWLRRETAAHSKAENSDNVGIFINRENSAYPSAPQAENNDNSAAGIVRVMRESKV